MKKKINSNNNNKSRHLPLYIDNPDMMHKSYLYRGHMYLYCYV